MFRNIQASFFNQRSIPERVTEGLFMIEIGIDDSCCGTTSFKELHETSSTDLAKRKCEEIWLCITRKYVLALQKQRFQKIWFNIFLKISIKMMLLNFLQEIVIFLKLSLNITSQLK